MTDDTRRESRSLPMRATPEMLLASRPLSCREQKGFCPSCTCESDGARAWAVMAEAAPMSERPPADEDDPLLTILYSALSGTTDGRLHTARAMHAEITALFAQRSMGAPSKDAEDAARWRWVLENATRMSQPLQAGRPNSHAITGHRVSLIVDFKGDHTTAPWATAEAFTEHVDMERLST